MARSFAALAALALGSSLALGCSKPQAPQLVPKEITITSISPIGVTLLAKVEATNPNSFALSTQSVTAKLVMDGRFDVGTGIVPKPLTLPPGVPTLVEVPFLMRWQNAANLPELAAMGRDIPYTFTGTMKVGNEKVWLEVPFAMSGVAKRDQFIAAGLQGIQNLVPGLTLTPPTQ